MCLNINQYSYYEDDNAMQCKDYICECANGYYLSFYIKWNGGGGNPIVTCLKTEDLKDLYPVNGTNAYASDYLCREYLGMYTYDDRVKLCITKQACTDKGLFLLNDTTFKSPLKCLTGE